MKKRKKLRILKLKNNDMREELGARLFPEMLQCILYYINTDNTEVEGRLSKTNALLQKLVILINLKIYSGDENKNELEPILVSLRK